MRELGNEVAGIYGLGHVFSTSEEFKNLALFLRLGLPSTLIRHGSGALPKRSSNRRNLKTLDFCFGVDGKHFRNETLKPMTS